MSYLEETSTWIRGRIIDGERSVLKPHPYFVCSLLGPVLGPFKWACPEHLGLSSIACGLAQGIFIRPCRLQIRSRSFFEVLVWRHRKTANQLLSQRA